MQLGISDPIEWLETIDDELLDKWMAYYRLEPFGNEWIQSAHNTAAIYSLAAFYAASTGVMHESPKWSDFMPVDYHKPKKPKKRKRLLSGDDALGLLKSKFKWQQ